MRNVELLPSHQLGRGFIPDEYLPKGKDEYYLRNEQLGEPQPSWRNLRAAEIETLVRNGNICAEWDSILVTERFQASRVNNTEFSGLVRIGTLDDTVLQHHDLRVPAGISNSRIISCDIGDNVAIHDVRYLAHYIIGNNCILLNIDEMHTTNHAKFGNGIVKDGEHEDVRIWLDLINETGGRAVMPFDGMISADACIWARYREDADLQKRLGEITQHHIDSRRGYYGTVGESCVIKSCRIIKDIKAGPCCYIKGANKLKNITVNSSEQEPTQIGEGVEMVNGIVGYGCHIFYGCKAIRFIMGNNTSLKYGARLLNSLLGDNSTVSCCEMLNNLIFPAHEQHHNNSFLTAALVLGQSNLAAGATIGSNHNSRVNDGEILAGRGFWPGLCTTIKHYSRFASFTLLAKGDYPAELDIQLPFSLLSNDEAHDRLNVMPAFWWMYNMYALARNTWKFRTRDERITRTQNIEFDSLAPDTVEELFAARTLLEIWTGKASLRANSKAVDGKTDNELAAIGRELLLGPPESTADLEVLGEHMERSRRKVLILKPREAYHAYAQMLHYYSVKNLLAYLEANPKATMSRMCKALAGKRNISWVNIGGQLAPAADVDKLLSDIKSGTLARWDDIHRAYDSLWEHYPLEKQRHAFATLLALPGTDTLDKAHWHNALDTAVKIQEYVRDQVFASRNKDYENTFRQTTFRNADEMKAVVGTIGQNSFVEQVRKETERFRQRIDAVRGRSW